MAVGRQRREKGLPPSSSRNVTRGLPVSESDDAVFELCLEKPVGFPQAEMERKGFFQKEAMSPPLRACCTCAVLT